MTNTEQELIEYCTLRSKFINFIQFFIETAPPKTFQRNQRWKAAYAASQHNTLHCRGFVPVFLIKTAFWDPVTKQYSCIVLKARDS